MCCCHGGRLNAPWLQMHLRKSVVQHMMVLLRVMVTDRRLRFALVGMMIESKKDACHFVQGNCGSALSPFYDAIWGVMSCAGACSLRRL